MYEMLYIEVVSSIVRLIIKVKQELDDGAKQVLRTILDKKYQFFVQ